MWFKGVVFLSYTALLVTPTNAAFRGQGKHSEEEKEGEGSEDGGLGS